jgi:hypothetical protein
MERMLKPIPKGGRDDQGHCGGLVGVGSAGGYCAAVSGHRRGFELGIGLMEIAQSQKTITLFEL